MTKPQISDAKKKRMEESTECRKIPLDMSEPHPEMLPFEKHIVALYGVPKVGKTKFVQELGIALQEKYGLALPGVYMLQVEPVNHRWRIRGAKKSNYLDTWPTFCQHVDDIIASKELCQTVKMFVIDTLDGAIPKVLLRLQKAYEAESAMQKIEGGNIHSESQDEIEYQILRLLYHTDAGVLILSHEREIDKRVGAIVAKQSRMDLSDGMFNRVADRCSMILHMRQMNQVKGSRGQRCLVALENDREHAGDNLGVVLTKYEEGVIPFNTEREAVDKLLACFRSAKTSKKKKSSKKKVMRHS